MTIRTNEVYIDTQVVAGGEATTFNFIGENAVTAATAGAQLNFTAGAGNTSGAGGAIDITGGAAGTTGVGGEVLITGGAGGATSGNAGSITLAGGIATGSGANGGVLLTTGGIIRWQVSNAGHWVPPSGGNNAYLIGWSLGMVQSIYTGTSFICGIQNATFDMLGTDATTATNAGVALNFAAGDGNTTGAGGAIDITAGQGGLTGVGGDLNITAGAGGATSGASGDVTISGGIAAGSGNDGTVIFISGATTYGLTASGVAGPALTTTATTIIEAINEIDARVVNASTNGFRLTLESGVPVSTSDQTAKTTIYFDNYKSDQIALYNGSEWVLHNSAEISLALGTLTSGKNYDVFAYDSSGTLTLELSAAWTNDTTRADAIARQDGVWVKSGTTTRRYVGTFRTTATTTTEDSQAKRFVWNVDNRVKRSLEVVDTTTTWTYSTATWRQARATTSNRVEFVAGLEGDSVSATVLGIVTASGTRHVSVGIGVDSTTVNSAAVYGGFATSGYYNQLSTYYNGELALGYHALNWLEWTQSVATITWGGSVGSDEFQAGIVGQCFA